MDSSLSKESVSKAEDNASYTTANSAHSATRFSATVAANPVSRDPSLIITEGEAMAYVEDPRNQDHKQRILNQVLRVSLNPSIIFPEIRVKTNRAATGSPRPWPTSNFTGLTINANN